MASALPEREGVVKHEQTGELYIPASQRPDGSWRKPRRVKDGYIPQEEVPTYENKGVQWLKSKPDLPPGLCIDQTEKEKPKDLTGMSKSAKKNAKRKEKKKQQESQSEVQVTKSMAEVNLNSAKSEPSVPKTNLSREEEKKEIEKKIRNLKKKVKQIEGLQQRIESGELKEPEKEQLEKISRKKEYEQEIEDLELELID